MLPTPDTSLPGPGSELLTIQRLQDGGWLCRHISHTIRGLLEQIMGGTRSGQLDRIVRDNADVVQKLKGRGIDMLIRSMSRVAIFMLPLSAAGLLPTGASAISVEMAKKCNSLVAKAFPPREPGNPAAGSAKGTAQDQRDYFNKCVTNGGNMDDATGKNVK